MKSHKIVSLQASNIKVLKAIEIRPDGNLVVLTGANGAGKSSVMDSIEMALSGADSIPKRPIRDGSSTAKIICDLGDLVVTRTFSATGSAIKVANSEGVTQKSPQAILDSLVGKLAFDPLEFSRMKSEAQLLTLRNLVGLDTTALGQRRAKTYEERTLVNREHDSAKSRLTLFPFDETAPKIEVDVTALTAQLTSAQEFNQGNADARRQLETLNANIGKAKTDVDTAELAVVEANGEVARIEKLLADAKAEVLAFEKTVEQKKAAVGIAQNAALQREVEVSKLVDKNTAAITEQINSAAAVNRRVQSNKSHTDQKKLVDEKAKKSAELTSQLDAIDAEKIKALSECKFPLEGLSIDGNEVLFNRLPFDQASTAQKLRVSVAIGMALNPNLRVMFIRDGSLLDPDGLKSVAELAEKNDYQIWIEDARSTDPTAILIQDGEINQPAE